MKIIHCADIHLDSKMSANLSPNLSIERNAELLSNFKRLVEYANSNDIKHILISGDLFDTRIVKNSTMEFIRNIISSNSDINFYYLRGNHDRTNDLKCESSNLITFNDEWTYNNIEENIVIAGIELNKFNSYAYYKDLKLSNDNINIVMLHGEISKLEGEEKIQLESIANHNIDYLALGHIHDHSYGDIDGRGQWVYSGCLDGRGFDECGIKGFVEIEVLDKSIQWKFIEFQRRKIESIDVDISNANMLEIENRINDAVKSISRDSILRVVLTGEYDISLRKDLGLLKTEFADRFYSFKIVDKSKLYIDKNKYEHDISLKGELIRLIKSREDIAEEEKDTLIMLGIQALSGEELNV